MASQVAIKMLGTNGGGFVNANAAHPMENPTPLSNFIQMLSIFLIPSALTYYLGRMVKSQSHGWAVWAAMFVLFLTGALVCWHPEDGRQSASWPVLGVDPKTTSFEGKEVRFGLFNPALCHDDDRRLLRRGQLHARFADTAGRVGAYVQHPPG